MVAEFAWTNKPTDRNFSKRGFCFPQCIKREENTEENQL